MLKSRNTGGVEIFRASAQYEKAVYKRVKEGVFRAFSPGIYTDKAVIIRVVNLMYKQYYDILDEYLPRIQPRDFVAFLVSEYERYGKVSDAHKFGKLSGAEEVFWSSGPIYARRAIKHLLELLCRSRMDTRHTARTQERQEEAISMVFIAAEELVSLYMRSDGYRYVLDEVTLTLDPGKYTYFHVAQDSSNTFDQREAVRDLAEYVPSPVFLQDVTAHGEVLNASFTEISGLTYTDTLGTLQWIINTYSDSARPEAVGGFEWEEAVSALTQATGISVLQAERILEGFSLSAENMTDRELFRPKQEYRAYRRGFFRDTYNGVNWVFFSRRMASECLTMLVTDVPFRKLPPEWRSPGVSKALDVLSLKAGRWFEKVVVRNLEAAGITGSPSVKALSLNKGHSLKIPADIGEIDFLGFHEEKKLLVIIEAKQVGFATEPRMYLDDLSKFTGGSGNYSTRFIKKYHWILDNIESVEKHFSHKFGLTTRLDVAGYAMITLYPTIAATKIEEFTCISLSEFMKRCHASRTWPFSKTQINSPPHPQEPL